MGDEIPLAKLPVPRGVEYLILASANPPPQNEEANSNAADQAPKPPSSADVFQAQAVNPRDIKKDASVQKVVSKTVKRLDSKDISEDFYFAEMFKLFSQEELSQLINKKDLDTKALYLAYFKLLDKVKGSDKQIKAVFAKKQEGAPEDYEDEKLRLKLLLGFDPHPSLQGKSRVNDPAYKKYINHQLKNMLLKIKFSDKANNLDEKAKLSLLASRYEVARSFIHDVESLNGLKQMSSSSTATGDYHFIRDAIPVAFTRFRRSFAPKWALKMQTIVNKPKPEGRSQKDHLEAIERDLKKLKTEDGKTLWTKIAELDAGKDLKYKLDKSLFGQPQGSKALSTAVDQFVNSQIPEDFRWVLQHEKESIFARLPENVQDILLFANLSQGQYEPEQNILLKYLAKPKANLENLYKIGHYKEVDAKGNVSTVIDSVTQGLIDTRIKPYLTKLEDLGVGKGNQTIAKG